MQKALDKTTRGYSSDQARALQTELSHSPADLLTRTTTAQDCVYLVKTLLDQGQIVKASEEYSHDYKSGLPTFAERPETEHEHEHEFDASDRIYTRLKARILLSDSSALSSLLAQCSLTLATLRGQRGTRGMFGVSDSLEQCDSLVYIMFSLVKSTAVLKGASEELVGRLAVAAYGCLLRQVQWLCSIAGLPRVTSDYYAKLTASNFRTLYAMLQRKPGAWYIMFRNVDIPIDEVKAILKSCKAAADKAGRTQLVYSVNYFSFILGYAELIEPEFASLVAETTMAHRADVIRAQTGNTGRSPGCDIYLCIRCGKGGIDEAGDKLISNCSFCRCEMRLSLGGYSFDIWNSGYVLLKGMPDCS